MKRTVLLACWLLGGGMALADDVGECKKALDGAKISMHDAVAAAKKEVADGKVVEVKLDWDNNASVYEVDLLVGDACKEVKVDAASGKVIRTETDTPDDPDDHRDLAETKKALDGAKQTFEQANAAVMKHAEGARIVEIELEMRAGKPTYEVKALKGDQVMKYRVDAVDGKVS